MLSRNIGQSTKHLLQRWETTVAWLLIELTFDWEVVGSTSYPMLYVVIRVELGQCSTMYYEHNRKDFSKINLQQFVIGKNIASFFFRWNVQRWHGTYFLYLGNNDRLYNDFWNDSWKSLRSVLLLLLFFWKYGEYYGLLNRNISSFWGKELL